jgi:hypothetical protein
MQNLSSKTSKIRSKSLISQFVTYMGRNREKDIQRNINIRFFELYTNSGYIIYVRNYGGLNVRT